MSLMFSRVAHNYAKNGFYPTDDVTVERILNFLDVSAPGYVNAFDPCCGEGVALKEIAHYLSETHDCDVTSYGVEVDRGRSIKANQHLDRVIYSDFFSCMIEAKSFDVCLFNPPYGNLIGDQINMSAGEKRLEKLFFRRSVGLLKPNAVSIMILDYPQLDKNFAERIARAFSDVSVYKAVDPTYKQVVIFGRRVKSHSPNVDVLRLISSVRDSIDDIPVIPAQPDKKYEVTTTRKPTAVTKFRTVTINPEIIRSEMRDHGDMLWSEFDSVFQTNRSSTKRPLTPPKPWHCAMAIISGCVNGFVTNKDGETLLIKGVCRKTIRETKEVNSFQDEQGTVTENMKIETEQYQSEIMAIDFTPGKSYGDVICIR